MALTGDVKEELVAVEVGKTSVRAAELAALLRFSGGLHIISGRIAVESELDSQAVAQRVRRDLAHEGRTAAHRGDTRRGIGGAAP